MLKENEEYYDKIKLSLQRKYDRLGKRFEEESEEEINDFLKYKTNQNTGLFVGSSIPVAITTGKTIIGSLGIVLAGIGVVAYNIFPSSQEEIRLAEQASQLLEDALRFTKSNGLSSITNLAFPTATLLITFFSNKVYEFRKAKKLGYLEEEKKNIRNIIKMMEDLKSEKEDETLTIPRILLSEVDLTTNTASFNYELLVKLGNYRKKSLKFKKGRIKEKEQLNSFSDLMNFIALSDETKGAGPAFLNNDYINYLKENCYVPDKPNKIARQNNSL